ncbi:FAD-dependent oxidoreductase [Planctomicrobium sp. SH664]|uniref:FAD-dependent oxidoreductase n=1 Tax=Planctomicrobium sp. SH664 TaxID=3448125 RepID=UPI003F5BA183
MLRTILRQTGTACLLWGLLASASVQAETILVEAESFSHPGGWSLDTQFINTIGSPYLLAHGLGKPVEDATTEIDVPSAGTYRVFVRTKDWVARWKAEGSPGKFQLRVDGKPLPTTFGTEGADWHWQAGGSIDLPAGKTRLELHDLTGFEGRCDAIVLTTESTSPPNDAALSSWRRTQLRLPEEPSIRSGYDLIVVGGGYSGLGAAISGARMGCKVALIQDRPVLGGNGSSEVRVWAQGLIRRGKYPRIGEIVEEFADKASKSPGAAEEFGDELKEEVVRAEKNIDLFLNHHAHRVDLDQGRIAAVYAHDTRTGGEVKFTGTLYCDATGHGMLGALAQADFDMSEKGRMGMSNMWAWDEVDQDVPFPETPWALDLSMDDFPYPKNHHGEWFWESGFDKDPLGDAEGIRDWNLRAVYGAFNAMKNRDGAADHKKAVLTWIAYIGGPRESRRLLGDVILTQEDVVTKRDFPDGCVPSTWSIDLHYPKQQYAVKYPENPFISVAQFDRRIDREFGYPVPYRCFYSRNVPNLFMAGRCISVTHEALGTVRVMKTCGMMGEVVGKAASLCKIYSCEPREIYTRYWPEMEELLKLPGKAYRPTVNDKVTIPADAQELATSSGPPRGLDSRKLPGIVIDNRQAKLTGEWKTGEGLKPFVGNDYVYARSDSGAVATFEWTADKTQTVKIGLAYVPHPNRGKSVPVIVTVAGKPTTVRVDMSRPLDAAEIFSPLGSYSVQAGDFVTVKIGTEKAQGMAHADAIQILTQN